MKGFTKSVLAFVVSLACAATAFAQGGGASSTGTIQGRVADAQGAEDLVQDACVVALQRPPREHGRFREWLATVMRNAAKKRVRNVKWCCAQARSTRQSC